MAESASTVSSIFDINTQISTGCNGSLNCRWISQVGVHNLLRCTDSNRPTVVGRSLMTERPQRALNGRYVDLGMLYLWSCTTVSCVLAWKAASRPCRRFEKSFLDRNLWVSEDWSMVKRGSTRKISCGWHRRSGDGLHSKSGRDPIDGCSGRLFGEGRMAQAHETGF